MLKGQMAVRKLVTVWKTNKETALIQDILPLYVHWTDYSPGRAKPLSRDVRPLADETSTSAIADQLIEQQTYKKGLAAC